MKKLIVLLFLALTLIGFGVTPTHLHAVTSVSSSHFVYGSEPNEDGTKFNPGVTGQSWVIIFVHGGGWTQSDPDQTGLDYAESLAAATGYRVYVPSYPTTDLNGVPERQVEPNAINDAVQYVANQSTTNPKHIILFGVSAGGQLALLDSYLDVTYPHPRVSAVVSLAGPADMTQTYNYEIPTFGTNNYVEQYEGAPPQDTTDNRYNTTSPATRTNPVVPPTYQAIAEYDPYVPETASKELATALSINNVVNRFDVIWGSNDHYNIQNEIVPRTGNTVTEQALLFISTHYAPRS